MPSSTAIHEAGHAVVARRLGIYVESATIEPNESCRGHICHQPSTSRVESDSQGQANEIKQAPIDEIIVCYSGWAAELRLTSGREEEARLGSGDDNEQAAKLLERLPGETEATLRHKSDRLVASNWKAIYLVALELEVWKRLDAEELDLLIDLSDENNSNVAIVSLVNNRAFKSRIDWESRDSEISRLQDQLIAVANRGV
jgi:hypothetical protein